MTQYGDNPFGFEDLEVYKAARRLRNGMYELLRGLPPEEKYALASQMRRAALSLTNNLAEGYGRHTWRDVSHFCRQARGSLFELVDDLNTCADQQYAEPQTLAALRQESEDVLKLINGYIRWLQSKQGEPR